MQKIIEILGIILRFLNPLANASPTQKVGSWLTFAAVVVSAVVTILQAIPIPAPAVPSDVPTAAFDVPTPGVDAPDVHAPAFGLPDANVGVDGE